MEDQNYTIKDIARMAGVSAGTVDRALHNRHERKYIKPLRQKVQYQCPCQIFAVWKNIPLQQTKELFQHNYQLYIMPQR